MARVLKQLVKHPEEDTDEDHDDRESEHIEDPRAGTSNHRSDDNFVTTFQLLKGYFDKKFRSLKIDLVEDAESNSHNVTKRGKQSNKHFSTRSGAAESSYPPRFFSRELFLPVSNRASSEVKDRYRRQVTQVSQVSQVTQVRLNQKKWPASSAAASCFSKTPQEAGKWPCKGFFGLKMG